ncbi:hypothetical protein [Pontibacter sp. SGAir0037]|uniref:hypothetical protein n=1 Tax=Pontibacter sp. SGAir0037 TaxID=2571030 RepID=UPI0010CCF07E|nr:hypothetical protein [Pontibacter sp. SGAir0037]QCR21454.1 hypothetical protein C1N53_03205 [Pontibacter sp. SGAir0037]
MRELERLQEGLGKSNMLLLKKTQQGLECIFLREGMAVDSFMVQQGILADALNKTGINGIVEGNNFARLKTDYSWFSLHVKSRALYMQLQQTQPQVFI